MESIEIHPNKAIYRRAVIRFVSMFGIFFLTLMIWVGILYLKYVIGIGGDVYDVPAVIFRFVIPGLLLIAFVVVAPIALFGLAKIAILVKRSLESGLPTLVLTADYIEVTQKRIWWRDIEKITRQRNVTFIYVKGTKRPIAVAPDLMGAEPSKVAHEITERWQRSRQESHPVTPVA